MQFRIEDLNLSRQYIERDGKVGEQLDWVTATETKLAKSEPRIPATEIEPLEKEIENLEVRSITSLTCHYLEQEIGIVYLKIWIKGHLLGFGQEMTNKKCLDK